MIKNKEKLKKGQEEMVGFVVIVIIISVIILVLLGFMMKTPSTETVNNYEIESFIQSCLQYTTECEGQLEFLSVEDLIVSCEYGEICLNEKNSCEVLNETLEGIIGNSWTVKNGSAIKGYNLVIITDEEEALVLKKGNETRNYKGAFQDFAKGSTDYEVSLKIYY